jgi:hypothetical protein
MDRTLPLTNNTYKREKLEYNTVHFTYILPKQPHGLFSSCPETAEPLSITTHGVALVRIQVSAQQPHASVGLKFIRN